MRTLLLIGVAAATALASCAPERKNFAASSYHNLTAHYNAYYLAKEGVELIRQQAAAGSEDNYNEILKVLPTIDTTVVKAWADQAEDVMVKSSIAIERHGESRWQDDAYLTLGQGRFFSGQFTEAIETFKYINTEITVDDTRHAALIWLMRTFIETREYQNALAVSKYLQQEQVSRRNQRELFVVRALLHQRIEQEEYMAAYLKVAAADLPIGEDRARLQFIIGQTYQELGYDSAAHAHYVLAKKSRPGYLLGFHTRLNMASVQSTATEADRNKVERAFNKLLKDRKNEELRDRIYYARGEMYRKQAKLDLALIDYQAGLEASQGDERQKGYNYWKIGVIHFDSLENYELASFYYDSAKKAMPETEPPYERIAARQAILGEFIKYLNTKREQDSLLALAALPEDQLEAIVAAKVEAKRAADEEAERERRRQERMAQAVSTAFDTEASGFASGGGGTGDNWYFYNPTARGQGEREFRMVWGDRPLRDHWRRSQGVVDFGEDEDDAQPPEQLAQAEGQESQEAEEQDPYVVYRQELLAKVPFSPEAQAQANGLVEEALYHLGKIYNFNLEQTPPAIESFEELLQRYDSTSHKPEVLYLLMLIYEGIDRPTSTRYREQLLAEFPESLYAKITLNPNYIQETDLARRAMKEAYGEAYGLFEEGYYAQAQSLVRQTLAQNELNDFTDNLEMLLVLITGKTESVHDYRDAIEEFQLRFPNSDLSEHATLMLEASEQVAVLQEVAPDRSYRVDMDQEHFLVLLPPRNVDPADLQEMMDPFLQAFFPNLQLRSNVIYQGEQALVTFVGLANGKQAMAVRERYVDAAQPMERGLLNPRLVLAMSRENFFNFYKSNALEEYRQFYQEEYLDGRNQ